MHGEVTEPEIDIFDRERVFIDRYLNDIRERFPALRIVFEHVTTSEGVDFVREGGDLTAATVTPPASVDEPQRPAGRRRAPA